MTRQKVLIVIDGLVLADYQKFALEKAGYGTAILTPAQFLAYLERGSDDFAVVVTESHIPHGPELSIEETDDGCYTGIALHNRLQKKFPKKPMVFGSEHEHRLQDADHLFICDKIDMIPSRTVHAVKHLLGVYQRPR